MISLIFLNFKAQNIFNSNHPLRYLKFYHLFFLKIYRKILRIQNSMITFYYSLINLLFPHEAYSAFIYFIDK
jgi:hypothetical protein